MNLPVIDRSNNSPVVSLQFQYHRYVSYRLWFDQFEAGTYSLRDHLKMKITLKWMWKLSTWINGFKNRVWHAEKNTKRYTRTKRPKSKTQWHIININGMQIVLIWTAHMGNKGGGLIDTTLHYSNVFHFVSFHYLFTNWFRPLLWVWQIQRAS